MTEQYNRHDIVKVWIDGACTQNHNRNGRRQAGFGVWFDHDDQWNDWGPVIDVEPTNNNAEIEAAIRAIRNCARQGCSEIQIRSDSKFVIKSVEEDFPKWRRNGWRKTDGSPLKNERKFRELDHALQHSNMRVYWEHVLGHRGDVGNEEANKLARIGARGYYNTYHWFSCPPAVDSYLRL